MVSIKLKVTISQYPFHYFPLCPYQYRRSFLHCLSLAQEHFFTMATLLTYLKWSNFICVIIIKKIYLYFLLIMTHYYQWNCREASQNLISLLWIMYYRVPSWQIIPIFLFLTFVGWNKNNLQLKCFIVKIW